MKLTVNSHLKLNIKGGWKVFVIIIVLPDFLIICGSHHDKNHPMIGWTIIIYDDTILYHIWSERSFCFGHFQVFVFITQKGLKDLTNIGKHFFWSAWPPVFTDSTLSTCTLALTEIKIKMSVQFWQCFWKQFANPWIFLHSEITRKWTLFQIKLKSYRSRFFTGTIWITIWSYHMLNMHLSHTYKKTL